MHNFAFEKKSVCSEPLVVLWQHATLHAQHVELHEKILRLKLTFWSLPRCLWKGIEHSWTSMKRHSLKSSEWIKRSVAKVPNWCPLYHWNFQLYSAVAVTLKSQRPLCIIFHWYLTVTYSRLTQVKLRIIFEVIFKPCFSPKIKGSRYFERNSLH